MVSPLYGAPALRRRVIVIAERKRWTEILGPLVAPEATHEPVPMVSILDDLSTIPDGAWIKGKIQPYNENLPK